MAEIKQFKPSTREVPKPEKPFEDSTDKKKVVEQLRNLADELEQKLKK